MPARLTSSALAVTALVITPLALACAPAESTSDGGEPDAPYVEATCTPAADDTFCPAYAEAFCTAHLSCCGDPDFRYPSMSLCVQRTTCLCTSFRDGQAAREGAITLDQDAADALLARLRGAPGACPVLEAGELLAGAAFRGSLREGDDCSPEATDYSSLLACGEGLYCYVTDFGGDMSPPRADCRRYLAEGEECDIGAECARGLYCAAGADVDDPGTCRAYLEAGAACDADEACASDVCDEDENTCAALGADDTWCVDATEELPAE